MIASPGHDGTLAACAPLARSLSDRLRDGAASGDAWLWPLSDEITLCRTAPGAVLALPARFEPAYEYPLVVWLPDPEHREEEIADWLQLISDRNYVALGIRPAAIGCSPDRPHAASRVMLDRLGLLLKHVEGEVAIHTERRYIAGVGTSGQVAIDCLLRRPEWFAGAISIDAPPCTAFAARTSPEQFTRRRVLWANLMPEHTSCESAEVPALRALGIDVEAWTNPSAEDPKVALARRIDHWIMQAIGSSISA